MTQGVISTAVRAVFALMLFFAAAYYAASLEGATGRAIRSGDMHRADERWRWCVNTWTIAPATDGTAALFSFSPTIRGGNITEGPPVLVGRYPMPFVRTIPRK